MIVDVHCHCALSRRYAQPAADARLPLVDVDRPTARFSFEPAVIDGEAAFDACIAPRITQRPTFACFRRMLGLDDAPVGPQLDAQLAALLDAQTPAGGRVDRYVLLAFDWHHRTDGTRSPLPVGATQAGNDMYTSNSLIRHLCRLYPDRYAFGASIHPYRPEALDALDEVFAAGACLIKWMPLHQNIDPRDRRTEAFLRRCARLGLPVLSHHNEEFTLSTPHPEFRPVHDMLALLRRLHRESAMPPFILAHVATPVTPFGEMGSFEGACEALLGDLSDAPLYADISALTTWGKVRFLRQIAARPEMHAKLLFGSDFPVPVAMPRLRRDLRREFHRIAQIPDVPGRLVEIYRAAGFQEIVFHRAAEILPNLRRVPAPVS